MLRQLIQNINHEDPDIRARARRWRILILLLFLVFVVTPSAIGLRKILVERRLDRLFAKTKSYLAEGDISKANVSALDAFEEASEDPRALRAMAYFASYVGVEQAGYFWGLVETTGGGCTAEDYRHRIASAERRGETGLALGLADKALAKFPVEGEILLAGSRAAIAAADWSTSLELASRAAGVLPVDDMRPVLRSAIATVYGGLGGQARIDAAINELARMAARADSDALEALRVLAELGQSGASRVRPEEVLRLLSLHPDPPLPLVFDVYDLLIQRVPQDTTSILEKASAEHAAMSGPDLLHLAKWLNKHYAFSQTLEVLPASRVAEYPELVGPRAEALLVQGNFYDLERMLAIPNLALPEAHRYYILAEASGLAGRPVGGRDFEDHLNMAEGACRREIRPDMSLLVGSLAMRSGLAGLARRAFGYAASSPAYGVEGERKLLALADSLVDRIAAAEHARRIAELLPESIEAQAEAVDRILDSGGELELALLKAEELAEFYFSKPLVTRVLTRARSMHGMRNSSETFEWTTPGNR